MSFKKELVSLRLTKKELIHIRDVMSIAFPAENSHGLTVSQSLAELENRNIIEFNLWKKIVEACTEVGIMTGEEAPDYVIQMNAPPKLRVYEVMSDDDCQENDEEEEVEEEETADGAEEA
jgi:hypothetical protein